MTVIAPSSPRLHSRWALAALLVTVADPQETKGEPKGFREEHFTALLDAAQQNLGDPIVLVQPHPP